MKKKILNIVTFAMIGWGAISATYLALPPEIKELLPNMNWVTAVVSGGSTTLLGAISIYVRGYVNKSNIANNEALSGLTNFYIQSKEEYAKFIEYQKEVITAYKDMKASTDRNNELLEAVLQTKLDNPLLTDTARELINNVLGVGGVDEDEQVL